MENKKVYVLMDTALDGLSIVDIFSKKEKAIDVMEDMLNETMYERFAMKQGRYLYPAPEEVFFDEPGIYEWELS